MRRYTGIDVVRSVISEASATHAKTHTWKFKVADFTVKPLPLVDLIFCRDALQHLPMRMVSNFLLCDWAAAYNNTP